MNPPLLIALGAFMLALVNALVMEGWRTSIRAAIKGHRGGKNRIGDPPSISVIVPARDAASTLTALLQDLYEQDMPRDRYEVLIVDDHSTDGTRAIAERIMRSWPGMKLILLEEHFGKKAAIMEAAEEALHDLVLITDADARCGRSRLSALANHWSEISPDLLLMPVDTLAGKGIISGLQRTEQLALQAVAAGSGTMEFPILANGANMAFSRSTFFQLGGFRDDRWASGDDMFLLQRMRRARKRIAYLLDPDVVVTVQAEPTSKAAFQQRLRWAGKMRAYKEADVILASLAGLILPWVLALATWKALSEVKAGQGLMNTVLLLISAWLLWSVPIIRLVDSMDAFFTHAAQRVQQGLQRQGRVFSGLSTIPALIAFMIYAPIIAILSIFVRPIWKGRRI